MKFEIRMPHIIGAVSALALMVAVSAYTEANATSSVTATSTISTNADIKQTLLNASETVSDKTKSAYETIKARIIDEQTPEGDVTINTRMTAKGMLNQPVYNMKNDKVGVLKDIILDKDGKARMVVVSDGGFMGVGDKLAAFDYNLVMRQEADGDVVMPLTDDLVTKASAFSYDKTEASDKIEVMPENGYSVAELMKGRLVNPKSESMGSIENITFRNGEASQVIVAFDQKLGTGGERAALDFDDLTLAKAGDGALDFRMNTYQSAKFEQYKSVKLN